VGLELKPTGLAADPRQSEGFLVVGALFADVPNLTERETKAAAAAVKAQGIARQAAATYAVAGDSNGDEDDGGGGGQASGGKAAELPDAGAARERAAAQRRKAEREAARAMQAFQETLRARAAAAAAADQALLRRGSGDQGAPFKSKTGPTGLQSAPAAEGARPFGVDAQFANNCEDRVAVSWVDYRGKEVVDCHLERAQSKRIRTFAGHCWVARVAATGEVVHVVRVARDDAPVYWIGG
jgi:hypothetical protein